jgi:hypothetical protein
VCCGIMQVAVSLVQLSAHMGPAMASTAYLAVCLVHRLVDSASSPPPSPVLPLVRNPPAIPLTPPHQHRHVPTWPRTHAHGPSRLTQHRG